MKIGFNGLGAMGAGMAMNLLHHGVELLVYDVNEAARNVFVKEGAAVAESAEELSETDILFLSLPNTAVVQSVLLGDQGIGEKMKPGSIIVDLSTISYQATVKMYEYFKKQNVFFLDAPVSGMAARAKDGTLTVMCGGEEEAFKIVCPYLECVATTIQYMGKSGNGQLSKLVNQLLFDINAAALAEIMPMAARMGLDCKKIGEIVNHGTGCSYASEFFIPRILKGNFSEGYPIKSAYKDLVSASELGVNNMIPMPLLAAATTTFQLAMRKGLGDCDKGGIIQVFEDLLGVSYRCSE